METELTGHNIPLRENEVHYELNINFCGLEFTKWFRQTGALRNRTKAVELITGFHKHFHTSDRYKEKKATRTAMNGEDLKWILSLLPFLSVKKRKNEIEKIVKEKWWLGFYKIVLTAYFSEREFVVVYEDSRFLEYTGRDYYAPLFEEARYYDARDIYVPDMQAMSGGSYDEIYGCTRYISEIPDYKPLKLPQ